MTPQELADELARLAGWKFVIFPGTKEGMWECSAGKTWHRHDYPVGSIDALEAFRVAKLCKWKWAIVKQRIDGSTYDDGPWYARLSNEYGIAYSSGPDEWTARASALVAAAREEMK